MRLLSTVRWDRLPPASFVTLTYHRPAPEWQQQFAAFLQELRRRGIRYLWRLELQKRGAPHWHLILWCPPSAVQPLRGAWHRIAANGSRRHIQYGFHVRKVESYRAACAYVSKYVSKVSSDSPHQLTGHRHWGASRSLPTAPHAEHAITEAGFYQLRRFARRLIRSRNRQRRMWRMSPANLHLFVSHQTAARALEWVSDHVSPLPPSERRDDCRAGPAHPLAGRGGRLAAAPPRRGREAGLFSQASVPPRYSMSRPNAH